MHVLMIGGTGFVGPHVVARLCHLGHEVTVLHRGRTAADLPPGVRHIRCPAENLGDRSYFSDLAPQLKNPAPDVVVDMIPVTEADARAVTRTFRGAARRVVAISSQDVYRAYGLITGAEEGPPDAVPLTEDAPLRTRHFPYRADPPRAADDPRRWMDDYDKIHVEQVVLQEPELPGTILRFPMVYGPRDRQHRSFEYVRRMQDRRPAILLDESLARWRWTRGYAENIAAAVTLAVTDPRAAGKIYNVGEPEAMTTAEWVRAIGRAFGWEGQVRSVPRENLPPALQAQGALEQDLVTDATRIRQELGYTEPVTRKTAIARTVAWEAEHPPESGSDPPFDYQAEDAVLAALSEGEKT